MIRSRPENLVRSWLFVGMLAIPGIVMLFAPRQDVSQREARVLARRPGLVELAEQPFDYSSLWDAYLKDNFGMRDWLLDITSVIRWDMKSPSSAKVIVGKKGWLFFEEGLLPTSENELDVEQKVARQIGLIRAISDRLRKQGIPLLVVPTVDKHTLYPEYLPSWLDHRPQSHALDELIAGVRFVGVDVIDIRAGLAASKDRKPLYFLTDTHWTPIGAAAAFNMVSGFSRGLLGPVKVSQDARLVPGPPHDLARMAGFDSAPLDWAIPGFSSSYPQAAREELQISDNSLQKPFVLRRPGPGSRILIVGDSFSGHWPTYALESANTVYWSHHNQCLADWHELLALEVDLVIYQMLERTIGCPPLGPEIMTAIEVR
jgi:alginate O-acetyltransferase complex protein AlgJ